jgi:hypothetical protein
MGGESIVVRSDETGDFVSGTVRAPDGPRGGFNTTTKQNAKCVPRLRKLGGGGG